MNRKFPKMMSVAMGAIALGFFLVDRPCNAANLTFVGEGDLPPQNWTNLGWNVEGRAGVRGAGDWEVGIKESEGSVPFQQIDWIWKDGEEVPWLLEWNGTTLTYTFGTQPSISYSPINSLPDEFDGFYLWTRATTEDNKVAAGTEMLMEVTGVKAVGATNFTSVSGISSSAIAPMTQGSTDITKNFFQSDSAIAALRGTVRMSWNGAINPNEKQARSRVGFKIEGFDSEEPASVPEPTSAIALVSLAVLLKRAKN